MAQKAIGATDGQDMTATTVIPRADIADTAVVCTACHDADRLGRTDSPDHTTTRPRWHACGATGVTQRDGETVTSAGVIRRVPIDPDDPVGQQYHEIVADDLIVGFDR
jgi:hypothetical protein